MPCDAFREGLRSLGYIEGGNVLIEYRWAAGKNERLAEMAAELVRFKVDLIVTQASTPVTAAKLATSTIPIVMTAANDPLGSGLKLLETDRRTRLRDQWHTQHQRRGR